MGTRSALNWSDTIIEGVTFGIPAGGPDADPAGPYVWDGGVPSGVLDDAGLFQPDGTDENGDPLDPFDLEAVMDVKYKKPKGSEMVPILDEDGNPVLDEDGNPTFEEVLEVFHKDDVLEIDAVLYTCQKSETTVLPPSNDWKIVKTKKDKEPK